MLQVKIKYKTEKKKLKPRLPLDAVLKLHSHPVATKKGVKGYDRKRLKKQERGTLEEENI
jgi:hypothetical protein